LELKEVEAEGEGKTAKQATRKQHPSVARAARKLRIWNKSKTAADIPVELPREGDKWLMREFIRIGFTGHELERLNRVRIYLQVVFLSDILGASGKTLDSKYYNRRVPHEQWRS
jgi:hypothetical protein